MGDVYRPEDFVGERRKPSDLSPGWNEAFPKTLQEVIREVKFLKSEMEKIKRVLKANGIVVE